MRSGGDAREGRCARTAIVLAAAAAFMPLSSGLAQPPAAAAVQPAPSPTVIPASAPAPTPAQLVEVLIREYRFEPARISIRAGTTVVWKNAEKRASHSVLFSGEGARESERIFPGESWSRSFDAPGVYHYICGPHPEMAGTIEVTE
jgi:plastocyanin